MICATCGKEFCVCSNSVGKQLDLALARIAELEKGTSVLSVEIGREQGSSEIPFASAYPRSAMKYRVKVWFPVHTRYCDELEVDIPEGEDPEAWLYEHKQELVEGHRLVGGNLEGALEVGYAGAELLGKVE